MDIPAEILARLRSYPLYNFDQRRVAAGAFSAGEKCPDNLRNWLDAEREETLLQVDASLLLPTGWQDFLGDYDLVDSVRFVTNEPRHKETRGNRRDPTCAICGQRKPQATFRTEAHLLPACTGNRFLHTADECDRCNLGGGKSTETELGKMLTAHRAMGRIQTRSKPSTKLKLQEEGSFIGGQEKGAPLTIGLVEGGDTLEVRDVGDNLLEITGKSAPFRPILALRSLGRSAWHLLDKDRRAAHAELLAWVENGPPIGKAQYLEAFLPGPGLIHTTFCVWTRKAGLGPALIYLLAFANVILIVPSPEFMESEVPIPVPPLPSSPYGAPQLRRMRVTRDDEVKPTFSYEVKYLARHLVSTRNRALATATVGRLDGSAFEVACHLTVEAGPTSRTITYVLDGGGLVGTTRLIGELLRASSSGALEGGRWQVAYELAEGDESGSAAQTEEFVSALCSGATLKIVERETGWTTADIQLMHVDTFDRAALHEALALSVAGNTG